QPVVTTIIQELDVAYVQQSFDIVFNVVSNPVTVTWDNCCRISTLLDGNNDQNWRLRTIISADPPNTKSPKSTSLPLVYATAGVDNQIFMPSVAFDNTVNRFRIAVGGANASTTESFLNTAVPLSATGQPALTLDPSGVIHFTPRTNSAFPALYAFQMMIGSYDQNNGLRGEVPLDLIFSVQAPAVAIKTAAVSAPQNLYTIPIGTTQTFDVTATLTPQDAISAQYTGVINNTPLPSGATFTKVSGGTGVGSTVYRFSWTPQLGMSSTNVCFQAVYSAPATTVVSAGLECVTLNLGAIETRLTLAGPATGFVGDTPEFTATLTRHVPDATPEDAPLPQRTVLFQVEGPDHVLGPVVSALTGSTGDAHVHLQLPKTGGNRVTAPFAAIANELLQSSAATTNVTVQGNSRLAAPTTATNPPPSVGFASAVSALLTALPSGNPAPPGNAVDFTIHPDASAPTVVSGPTDATGVATAAFTAAVAGASYTAEASFAGNNDLTASGPSAPTPFTVYQRVKLSLAPSSPLLA